MCVCVCILREIKSNHQQQQSLEHKKIKTQTDKSEEKTNEKFRPKTNKAATKLH